jgi:hypothetical protein
VTDPAYRWVAGLPARTLRELAALAERQERPEFIDTELAVTELVDMLAKGQRPTIGWYRYRGLDTRENASRLDT